MSLNLLQTEVETDLRSTLHGLLEQRCDRAAVTAMYDGNRALVTPLWRTLTDDLGLAGLLVPESLGGAGASAREAAVVLEELARYVAPVPFLTSSVIVTTALLGSRSAPLPSCSALLVDLAEGKKTAALAVPWSSTPADFSVVDGERRDITSVAGALESDVLLVPVRSDRGVALHAIPATETTLTPVISLDMSRQLADVHLGDLGEVVLPDAADAIQQALMVGSALLSSEQVGLARWCLDETLSYLKVRKQFGRAVGGFQAIKHRLADLYTDIESAGAVAAYAAAVVAAEDEDLPVATAVAQSWCADVAVRAAEEAVQLHGGIGMTWEHPAHLYLKRAKADQIALGTPGAHRAQLAVLVNL